MHLTMMMLEKIHDSEVDENTKRWMKLFEAIHNTYEGRLQDIVRELVNAPTKLDITLRRLQQFDPNILDILAETIKLVIDTGWMLHVYKHNRIPICSPEFGRRVFYLPAKMPEK